ncbi:hypothetical protein VYU27_002242 [Nannochloropsis oceanica]
MNFTFYSSSSLRPKTRTEIEQEECERMCVRHLRSLEKLDEHEASGLQAAGFFNDDGEVRLLRKQHLDYVMRGLRYLGPGFICLDASRPWLCYWMLHSIDLLKGLETTGEAAHADVDTELLRHVMTTMASCQNVGGGFGGGTQQLSHCAPTYAAVLALLIVGTEEAYRIIDRPALYRWFLARKHPSGGFCMHDDGEVDVRGTYTVISIASLLNLLTPELTADVADYLLSCQTYEGGFGGEPGQEAHGGYVFCAFAALVILGRAEEADLVSLEGWVARRQMEMEGGFQGRTNKLVDGCYSFWQGATAVLVDMVLSGEGEAEEAVGWRGSLGQAQPCSSRPSSPCLQTGDGKDGGSPRLDEVSADDAANISYKTVAIQPSLDVGEHDTPSLGRVPGLNQHALQRYILHCAQALDGGLRDKPGKPRDFYHTCYNLSGLSCAQWGRAGGKGGTALVYGDVGNLLHITNPVYNIRREKVERALRFYYTAPASHGALLS